MMFALAAGKLDKFVFFFALVAGIAVIVGLDRFEVGKLYAVGACIALLLAYAAVVLTIPGLRLRPDQTADNCYYLGLLFTLTSLGVALSRFATLEAASESILRNFGIAIFTTIVGLGLRVGISQFRQDPEDLEHEAREALADTVRRLRGELDQSLAEFQRFSDGARQALQETVDAARSSTVDTLSVAVTRFEKSLAETTKRFNDNTAAFAKRAGAINGSLDKVSTSIELLSDRISSVRADPALVREGLQPAFEALTSTVTELGEGLSAQRSKIQESLEALASLADVMTRFEDSTGGLSRAAIELEKSVAALSNGPSILQQLSEAMNRSAQAAETLSINLENAASRAGDAAEDTIRGMGAASVDLAARTQTTLLAVEEAASRAAETMNRLNSEFAGSGETVERVRRELAELAAWIIQRLERA